MRADEIPIPDSWQPFVRKAIIHTVSFARYTMMITRGGAENIIIGHIITVQTQRIIEREFLYRLFYHSVTSVCQGLTFFNNISVLKTSPCRFVGTLTVILFPLV